ncbi:outer membrane transport energization protein TonB [Paraburkholderia caballeronis]|nr:outer membrane transport energization protein TonB [Paraburkholderia caballeronis]
MSAAMTNRLAIQMQRRAASGVTGRRRPSPDTVAPRDGVARASALSSPGGSRQARVSVALTATAVLALHVGFIWLAHEYRSRAAVQRPVPLPMTVELTQAPAPLPQAAQATPSPPVPAPPTPPRPKAAQPRPARVPAHQAPAAQPAAPPPAAPHDAVALAPAPADTGKPPPRAPAAPPRETAPIGDAAYLHNPAPDYPQIAQERGWQGRVLLRVHVLASGQPDSVAIQTGSGRRLLDDAAQEAVRRWTFVPARRGDEPTDGWVTVPIDFRLDS